MFKPMVSLSAVILLTCNVSAWAGSSIFSDPDMRSDISVEMLSIVGETVESGKASNRALIFGSYRHRFSESLRALVEVPILFMHVPAQFVGPVPDPPAPLPEVQPSYTKMHLGNVRVGVEFGAADDIRTSVGIGLPVFNGVEGPSIGDEFVVDLMRSHVLETNSLQVDGHVHMWMMRDEKRDIQVKSGLRMWIETRRGSGLKAIIFDAEGLIRLHVGDFDIMAGASISATEDNSVGSPLDENFSLLVHLGTNYEFVSWPMQVGVFLTSPAHDKDRTPSAVLALNISYLMR